jgi:hypothetical protein
MPRSASATLTHSLAKLLNVPVVRTSIGAFPDYYFAPSWLGMFLEGGAVSQDHFMLNEFNLGVLKNCGARDIFVTVRDPRAAARSQARWQSRRTNDAIVMEERIQDECISNFIPWLQNWIERSRDQKLPVRIHLIKFQDIITDLAGTARYIANALRDACPAMEAYAERSEIDEIRVHFDRGDDDTWRSEVSEPTRAMLWEACTPDIREFLRLTP